MNTILEYNNKQIGIEVPEHIKIIYDLTELFANNVPFNQQSDEDMEISEEAYTYLSEYFQNVGKRAFKNDKVCFEGFKVNKQIHVLYFDEGYINKCDVSSKIFKDGINEFKTVESFYHKEDVVNGINQLYDIYATEEDDEINKDDIYFRNIIYLLQYYTDKEDYEKCVIIKKWIEQHYKMLRDDNEIA